MTDDTTTNLTGLFAQVEPAREAYKKQLDDSYWALLRQTCDAYDKEHEALTEMSMDDGAIYDPTEIPRWIDLFVKARHVVKDLLAVARLREAVDLPIFQARIIDVVTVYVLDPVLQYVDDSYDYDDAGDREQLTKLIKHRAAISQGAKFRLDFWTVDLDVADKLDLDADPSLWSKEFATSTTRH